VITTAGEEIDVQHLPAYMRKGQTTAAPQAAAGLGDLLAGRRLEEVERAAILATLGAAGGNKTRAAKMLGIGLKTLYRKLEAYRKAGVQMPEGD
jgi:DNA-binding NtrC family response regulator